MLFYLIFCSHFEATGPNLFKVLCKILKKKKKNRLSLSLGDAIVDTKRYIKLTKYIEIYTINDLVDAPSQITPLV